MREGSDGHIRGFVRDRQATTPWVGGWRTCWGLPEARSPRTLRIAPISQACRIRLCSLALLIAKPATDRSLDGGPWGGADHLVEDLAVPEQEQCRNALDAQPPGDLGILIHVQLRHLDGTGQVAGQFFDDRCYHPARRAPVRPAIQ